MDECTLTKWTESQVTVSRDVSVAVRDEFDRVLDDAADERPLQTLLASHPSLLVGLAPAGRDYWCLDRPRLGSELIPDFLLASRTSAGIRWAMIELEGPNETVLTKAGLPTKKLAEAQRQIRDWRTWLTDNVAYARGELGLRDIEARCPGYIIIGRRTALDPKQAKAYGALSGDGTNVMSYDRLRDLVGRNIWNGEDPHG